MTTSPPTASPKPSAWRSTIIPEAVAILKERMAKIGGELNEARLRMARIPARRRAGRQQGVGRARLLDRQCDRDGGRAGDHAGDARRGGAETEDRRQAVVGNHPRRRQGRRRRHRTRRHRQGAIRTRIIGSYPFFDEKLGPNTNIVVRSRDAAEAASGEGAVEDMLTKVKAQLAARRANGKHRCRHRNPTARRARIKSFPSPGTSSTATRARSPGGCTRRGRSRRSSASPAAGWCRRRSWRAN